MPKKCKGCGRLDTTPLGLNSKGEPYLACCPDNNYVEITAVEWLESKLPTIFKELTINKGLIEQAKQMGKEQIKIHNKYYPNSDVEWKQNKEQEDWYWEQLDNDFNEISDDEIEKIAKEYVLYNESKRNWVVEGMKLYREKLKKN